MTTLLTPCARDGERCAPPPPSCPTLRSPLPRSGARYRPRPPPPSRLARFKLAPCRDCSSLYGMTEDARTQASAGASFETRRLCVRWHRGYRPRRTRGWGRGVCIRCCNQLEKKERVRLLLTMAPPCGSCDGHSIPDGLLLMHLLVFIWSTWYRHSQTTMTSLCLSTTFAPGVRHTATTAPSAPAHTRRSLLLLPDRATRSLTVCSYSTGIPAHTHRQRQR